MIREGYAIGKEKTPIITFSAAVMETDKETAIAAGANDVISKPFEVAVLHRKIKEYLITD
ncbi:Response regulator receiver domain protein [compost metagenome]